MRLAVNNSVIKKRAMSSSGSVGTEMLTMIIVIIMTIYGIIKKNFKIKLLFKNSVELKRK